MEEACGVGWELEGYNIYNSWDYQGMFSVLDWGTWQHAPHLTSELLWTSDCYVLPISHCLNASVCSGYSISSLYLESGGD